MSNPFLNRDTGDSPEEKQRHRDLLLDLFGKWDAAGAGWGSFDHPALDLSEAQHENASDALIDAGLISPDWAWADESLPILTDAGRAALAARGAP